MDIEEYTDLLVPEQLERQARMFLKRSHDFLRGANLSFVANKDTYRKHAIECAQAATYYFREARIYREMVK